MTISPVFILAIESSCDDTAAAVLKDDQVLSNIVANQLIHNEFGGVVPELASRAHQQNIVPVIDAALKKANISKKQLSAIAFTQGPGLMGSLLVGSSFAKSFSMALKIPLIAVNIRFRKSSRFHNRLSMRIIQTRFFQTAQAPPAFRPFSHY